MSVIFREATERTTSEVIRAPSFSHVEESWSDLLEHSHFRSPFLSFEWMASWWKVFGRQHELWLVLVKSESEVVIIAPLMLTRRMGFRVLEFVGTGRTDHLGILIKEGHEHLVGRIFDYLYEKKRVWDVLSLRDLTSETYALLSGIQVGLKSAAIQRDESPYIPINGSWEDYLSSKTPKHRKNIRRLMKMAEGNPSVEIRCVRSYSEELLRKLRDVESSSWKNRRGDLRMSGSGFDFFAHVLSRFADRGWLEVWQLCIRGRLIAYLINFCHERKTYYYNGAYDENEARRLNFSPGSALLASAVREACARGIREYDFLRGAEAYKQLWARETRPLFHIVYRHGSLRSYLGWLLLAKARWVLREHAFFVKARQFILIAMRRLGMGRGN